MARKAQLKEDKYHRAAVLYNLLKHFPSFVSISIPRAMLCCKFTLAESNDLTEKKRVERLAAGKETHATARAEFRTAAQVTFHESTDATTEASSETRLAA